MDRKIYEGKFLKVLEVDETLVLITLLGMCGKGEGVNGQPPEDIDIEGLTSLDGWEQLKKEMKECLSKESEK